MAKRVIAATDLDPADARAKIARTRKALTEKLGILTSRLFGTSHERTRKKMVAKKSNQKSSNSRGKAKNQNAKTSPSKKRGGKVNKVMGEMLAGAAIGAVKGAAEALPTPRKSK